MSKTSNVAKEWFESIIEALDELSQYEPLESWGIPTKRQAVYGEFHDRISQRAKEAQRWISVEKSPAYAAEFAQAVRDPLELLKNWEESYESEDAESACNSISEFSKIQDAASNSADYIKQLVWVLRTKIQSPS